MQKLLDKYSYIFKFIITALILVIPLYPKFPSIRVPGIYVSIRLEDFLILFAFTLFLPVIIAKLKNIFSNSISRSMGIYLFVGLVSLISAIFVTKTVIPEIAILHYFRRVEYFSLFFIAFSYIKFIEKDKNSFLSFVLKLYLIVVSLVFLYGIGQRYFNFPVIITQNEEYSKGVALRWVPGAHINSTFAGHYDLASYLILISPLILTYFVFAKNKVTKILLLSALAFSFILLSLAVSRIAIVAFVVSCALPLIFYKKYKILASFLLISFIVFGTSPDLRIRYNRIFQVVKDKISLVNIVYADEGNVQEDRSTSIRLNVEWPRAIRAFNKNPLLGTGYSSISLATDNDYLRALGETGLLGFLSLILIIIFLVKFIYKKLSRSISDLNIFNVSLMGSLAGIIVIAVFIDILEASKLATNFWMFAGFVVGGFKDE